MVALGDCFRERLIYGLAVSRFRALPCPSCVHTWNIQNIRHSFALHSSYIKGMNSYSIMHWISRLQLVGYYCWATSSSQTLWRRSMRSQRQPTFVVLCKRHGAWNSQSAKLFELYGHCSVSLAVRSLLVVSTPEFTDWTDETVTHVCLFDWVWVTRHTKALHRKVFALFTKSAVPLDHGISVF